MKARRAFVVQKHRATALHYDFRLEHNGVMLSWAVPKGPSPDPTVKRLAMPTEPHPLEHNDFEGVIPEGDYGGGIVMIWDRGTWEPEVPDVDRALARGDLKFTLRGRKLRGSWVLVRTRSGRSPVPRGATASPGRPERGGAWGARGEAPHRDAWLLIKHRDAAASSDDLTATRPLSVVSRRTMAGIARAGEASARQLALAQAADPPRAPAAAPTPAGRAKKRSA